MNEEAKFREPWTFERFLDALYAAGWKSPNDAQHTNILGVWEALKAARLEDAKAPGRDVQERVDDWMLACFGQAIALDKVERNHRFLEEALELTQACGATASEAHQLVDYVFGRPRGEKTQEVGGVMVTLAALCTANMINLNYAADTEIARVWTKIEQIRTKQAAKPKHSPLPALTTPTETTKEKG